MKAAWDRRLTPAPTQESQRMGNVTATTTGRIPTHTHTFYASFLLVFTFLTCPLCVWPAALAVWFSSAAARTTFSRAVKPSAARESLKSSPPGVTTDRSAKVRTVSLHASQWVRPLPRQTWIKMQWQAVVTDVGGGNHSSTAACVLCLKMMPVGCLDLFPAWDWVDQRWVESVCVGGGGVPNLCLASGYRIMKQNTPCMRRSASLTRCGGVLSSRGLWQWPVTMELHIPNDVCSYCKHHQVWSSPYKTNGDVIKDDTRKADEMVKINWVWFPSVPVLISNVRHIITFTFTRGVRWREGASVTLNVKVICYVSLH